jgi:hypothetical protein
MFNTITADDTHDPFKIDNVYVAADIGTLIDSKSLALDNGAKDALIKLMLHLNAYSQRNDNYINKISSCINNVQSISKLVQNHTVRSERMTSHSYSGYIDFIFDKDKVKDIMNTCGLKYATKSDGETLLLPLVFEGKTYRLVDSESDNLLYDALNDTNEEFGLLYLKKMLNKNIFDVNTLDPKIFLNGTYKDVLNVLSQYSCTNAIVFLFKHLDKKSALVETKIIRMNTEYHESFKYQILPNETDKMFISRVIHELLKNADLVWKRGLHKDNEMIFSSGLDLEISHPHEWHKVRIILNKIQMIKQYKFKTISNDNIELELKYVGSPEMLSAKLLENGVIISKRGDKTIMQLTK